MRTISVRLDDRTDAALRAFCDQHGLSQADALKVAIEHLAERHKPSPAELAGQLGLIGAFRSGAGDLAADHSRRLKRKLRVQLQIDAPGQRPASGSTTRRGAESA
jgi:hypothetical protein